jgi:ankyrin repeat family A protein 2
LTPLHWASFYGQITTVQLLLQKGAIVDKEGKEGETALQLAAAGGHHDTLKILLSEGADLNHIDEVSIIQLL